jgi:hypothetical protein
MAGNKTAGLDFGHFPSGMFLYFSQQRRKLVATIPSPSELLRGSLLERTVHHSKGCARCDRGEGHQVLVLTITYLGGRNKQYSIRPEQRELVERRLKNYQEWKRKIEGICELNHAFFAA